MNSKPRRALMDDDENVVADPGRGVPLTDDNGSASSKDPLAPRRGVPLPGDVVERRENRRRARLLFLAIALALIVALVIVYFLIGGVDRRGGAAPRQQQPSSPSPVASESPEPTGTLETIDDTKVTMPDEWEIYADETTEKDRRLIRLREPESGHTMQITTLSTVSKDLTGVCSTLIEGQREGYEVNSEQVPSDITVDGDAKGVVCGFGGSKEGEDLTVRFTLIQRASDQHTLVVRNIHDRALADDAQSTAQATAMQCEAARNFGTPLPLC